MKHTLLGDLREHLLQQIDAPSDRRQDVLHPSEMAKADWCPRQSWFRLKGEPVSDPQKKHGYQLENIFDEGHYVHEKWQNRLWSMGVLEGMFQCLYCDHKWWATSPHECANPECEADRRVLVYREVPVDGYKRYLIYGHEDGKVARRLVEVKTIGQGTLRLDAPELLKANMVVGPKGNKIYDLDGIWRDLKRPLPSHLRQTGIYAQILNEQEDEKYHVDEIVFLYEYKANQDVKEFTVKVNPRHAASLLDSARDIKYALDSNTEIPRPGDRTEESKGCKTCEYFTRCWSPTSSQAPEGRRVDVEPRRRRRQLPEGPRGRADRDAGAAGGVDPSSSRGSNRPRRRRPDVPVPSAD